MKIAFLYQMFLLYQGKKKYKELGQAKLPCYKRVCCIQLLYNEVVLINSIDVTKQFVMLSLQLHKVIYLKNVDNKLTNSAWFDFKKKERKTNHSVTAWKGKCDLKMINIWCNTHWILLCKYFFYYFVYQYNAHLILSGPAMSILGWGLWEMCVIILFCKYFFYYFVYQYNAHLILSGPAMSMLWWGLWEMCVIAKSSPLHWAKTIC